MVPVIETYAFSNSGAINRIGACEPNQCRNRQHGGSKSSGLHFSLSALTSTESIVFFPAHSTFPSYDYRRISKVLFSSRYDALLYKVLIADLIDVREVKMQNSALVRICLR